MFASGRTIRQAKLNLISKSRQRSRLFEGMKCVAGCRKGNIAFRRTGNEGWGMGYLSHA
jgi:hypothetical protein